MLYNADDAVKNDLFLKLSKSRSPKSLKWNQLLDSKQKTNIDTPKTKNGLFR